MATQVDTIYLIHHSHTDIGYTHDQPIVWDLHRRFINEAIEQCERTADRNDDDAFRWTVETTGMLLHWLQTAKDAQIERFIRMARAGRIEVTAMLANITPLYDVDQLIESLTPVRRVRDELGLPVRAAMNSDVNGENWPLVDILLDLGIEGFSMAINQHSGGALINQPCAFHWVGPSGRDILAWNGFSYGLAHSLGITRDIDHFAQTGWPALRQFLDERDYPLPIVMLQLYDAFGDNGTANPGLSEFVRTWNARGQSPRLRVALPSEWWAAVRTYTASLPRWRGDWTDFWNYGCASSAREQAINRQSRARLFAADAAHAVSAALEGKEGPTRDRHADARDQAVHAINFWDEHTWGADCSVSLPEDDDTRSQWTHKAAYAHTGRSLSLMLARDGVAEVARRVERSEGDRLLVFNPLPWPRRILGPVPDPTQTRGRPADATAARHFYDRATPRSTRLLKPIEVPALGYRVVKADAFADAPPRVSDDLTIEAGRFTAQFDGQQGGIVSLIDHALNRELVDPADGLPFFGFVHETVADRTSTAPRDLIWKSPPGPLPRERGWRPGWPAARDATTRILAHRVERTELGTRIIQRLDAAAVRNLVQEIFIPSDGDRIECVASWDMTAETHPEATYLAFPFAMAGARARIDLGGQALIPGDEQLPGACRDYFTAQRWIGFDNGEWGVTIATPDAPMVQLGDFHYGDNQGEFTLRRALLLGWVTNNYWSTNFRAHQPGRVRARYVLRPYLGPFDEPAAHRFGAEEGVPALFQPLGEVPSDPPILPPGQGTLLRLPDRPILTLRIKPDEAGSGLVLRLLNASDQVQEASIGSAILRLRSATRGDLLERPGEAIPIVDGQVRLRLGARELACLRIKIDR